MIALKFLSANLLCAVLIWNAFPSCTNGKNVKPNTDPDTINNSTTLNDSGEINKPVIVLRDLTINQRYFEQKAGKCQAIAPALVADLGLSEVITAEELKSDPPVKIKIIDTLINTVSNRIYLIAKQSDNEQCAWLVQYANANKVKTLKKVYYQDFVEYFSTTTTRINNNVITVTTENDNGEEKSKVVETYAFDDDQGFRLIK